MRKFIVLLKKELLELMTIQMLLPLILGVAVFGFIGNIMGSEIQKSNVSSENIVVCDFDNTDMSKLVVETLSNNNYKIELRDDTNIDNVINYAKDKKLSLLLVIPEGFEMGIKGNNLKQIETYSIFKSLSLPGSVKASAILKVIEIINQNIRN